MRAGWPDLVQPARQERPAIYRQKDAAPGFESGGVGGSTPPDASIVARAPISYARGGAGELQPDPLAGLDDLFRNKP